MKGIVLKPFTRDDLAFAKEIYDYYVIHSTATFHTRKLSLAEFGEMIPVGQPKYRSFVVLLDDVPCGYCYLSQYKKREAYDRSAEVSLYLSPEFQRKGIGRHCLNRLEIIARESGIKVLLGIISADNQGSIRLCSALGYEKCAHFKQVGEKFGKVLDVVAFQKNLAP